MATYISYDAADSIIILLEPDTGIYRVSGHGDYQHPIEQLAGVQILPDWANWAKYTAPLLWFNLWHILVTMGTLLRCVGDLTDAERDAIRLVQRNWRNFSKICKTVKADYFPGKGLRGQESDKLSFDEFMLGTSIIDFASKSVILMPTANRATFPGSLEHLLATKPEYATAHADWDETFNTFEGATRARTNAIQANIDNPVQLSLSRLIGHAPRAEVQLPRGDELEDMRIGLWALVQSMRDAHPDRPAIVDVDGWPSYLSPQQIGILAAHGQAPSGNILLRISLRTANQAVQCNEGFMLNDAVLDHWTAHNFYAYLLHEFFFDRLRDPITGLEVNLVIVNDFGGRFGHISHAHSMATGFDNASPDHIDQWSSRRLNILPRGWTTRGMHVTLFKRPREAYQGAMRMILRVAEPLFATTEESEENQLGLVGVPYATQVQLRQRVQALVDSDIDLVGGIVSACRTYIEQDEFEALELAEVAEAAVEEEL